MNNRAFTLALAMAVVAVLMVQSYVSSIEEERKKEYGTKVLVLSAKRDIREMETLNETVVELKEIPKKFLEPSAMSFEDKENGEKEMKKIAGNVAIVPLRKGEQITFNKITEPSLRTGLAPQITPGKRAVTIPVSEISGVGKLVKPGDRVDLIAVVGFGEKKDAKMAKTLLQDVVVLAVGRAVTNNVARKIETDSTGKERARSLAESDAFNSVTLEVEPPQAQMIALLNSGSEIMLSLRNNDDTERVQTGTVNFIDLYGGDMIRLQQLQQQFAPQRTPAGTR